MEIKTDISTSMYELEKVKPIKTTFTEKISQDEAKELKEQITQRTNEMLLQSTTIQSSLEKNISNNFEAIYKDFQNFLEEIGYEGPNISELSKEEATELVSEDGFFGITQTSERIVNFVLNNADGNEDFLRAGRAGIMEGFKQAKELWGNELPSISKQTIDKSVEMLDSSIIDLGFTIIDKAV